MSLDSPQCPACNPGRMLVAETLYLSSLRDMPGGRDCLVMYAKVTDVG